MYDDRKYMIFNCDELEKIDFSTVLESGSDTVRKSVDGTLTFVKWDGEPPECVLSLTTKQGPYTYEEMLKYIEDLFTPQIDN